MNKVLSLQKENVVREKKKGKGKSSFSLGCAPSSMGSIFAC
ncbi:class III lanthipeptide [Staphylococcus simulans]|nr:class III lanthipeptide [Staphylococcus simulans]